MIQPMTTRATTIWHNPDITIQNEIIDIRDRKHNIRLTLDKVSKMYLSKSKPSYLSAMVGSILFLNENHYNLFIRTKDQEEIKIRVNGFKKQYYIDLISRVRKNIANSN